MSSFLCFICHSTVNANTNEETREKYREVVGMNLCPDSHLCHICCHVLNRLWLFRSVCLKRSLEYPVLFSEKGTLNIQRNYLELYTICPEDTCEHYKSRNLNSKYYSITHFDEHNDINLKEQETNDYVELYEDLEFENILATKYKQHTFDTANEQAIPEAVLDVQDTDCRYNFDDEKSHSDEASNVDNVYNEEELDGDINDYDNFKDQYTDVGYNDNDIAIINKEKTPDDDKVANEVKQKKKKVKKKGNKINKKFEKIVLSVEEQKAELERNRRIEKYIAAEFKCSNCAMGFLFKDTYQAHMMRHEESNGEHRCNICTLRFANPAVLRSHVGLHSERYRCLKCDFTVRKRQRVSHATDCYELKVDSVACHLCGRVFKDSNGVHQHLKRFHRSQPVKSYSCSVCLQRFNNPAAVRTHMIEEKRRPRPTRPRPIRPNNTPAICHLCGTTFKCNSKLNRHLREVCDKNRLEEELSSYYAQNAGV
ncbi:unnamed protein product [Chilo suppressalis]|uniref:C2H2-type domain-containing protein n=1 Tax=Chilo suppressalis TaxID=168631 RepID=A0ABN8LAC0_CHISP|nr:unnamed protein product [Chilo suppressalis]